MDNEIFKVVLTKSDIESPAVNSICERYVSGVEFISDGIICYFDDEISYTDFSEEFFNLIDIIETLNHLYRISKDVNIS